MTAHQLKLTFFEQGTSYSLFIIELLKIFAYAQVKERKNLFQIEFLHTE